MHPRFLAETNYNFKPSIAHLLSKAQLWLKNIYKGWKSFTMPVWYTECYTWITLGQLGELHLGICYFLKNICILPIFKKFFLYICVCIIYLYILYIYIYYIYLYYIFAYKDILRNNLISSVLFWVRVDRVCSSGWPWTHDVAQTGCEFVVILLPLISFEITEKALITRSDGISIK